MNELVCIEKEFGNYAILAHSNAPSKKEVTPKKDGCI
jgi:hypothetical protein